jgi:leucyl-tRNA synthetase
MGEKGSISKAQWPVYDEDLTKDSEVEVVLQVNGKVRAKLVIDAETPKDDMIALAMENERIQEYTQGKTVVKTIAVPKKLVNLVVK